MAAKKSATSDGSTVGLENESNGSSGESADPGIGGAAGGTSNAADAGSVGESGPRIAGLGVADPGAAGADSTVEYTGGINKDGTPTKKRGRKPGSGKSTGSSQRKQTGSDYKGLEKLLYSLHMMAAAATKTPEIAIDAKESEMLASAIGAVQDHYDFDVSEEVTLWVNLVSAGVAIYGPRVFVIYSRKQRERLEKRPSNVSHIRPAEKTSVPPSMNIPGMHDPAI